MRNSRGLKFMVLLAIGVFGLSLISCGGGSEKKDSSNPYTYDLSGLTLGPTPENLLGGEIIVTRTKDGSPAAGVSVTLSYHTYGGYGAWLDNIMIGGTTNANGKLAVDELLPDSTARKLVFSADNFGTYKELALGTLPAGFLLTGPSRNPDYPPLLGSYNYVNWNIADNICLSHGGQLPTQGQLEILFGNIFSGIIPTDWPDDDYYWTRDLYIAGYYWAVRPTSVPPNYYLSTEFSFYTIPFYVVCVPWP